MSDEQRPTGKDDASADVRRQTHQLVRAFCARSYGGADFTGVVKQVAVAARSPVLEAVHQMQRSWLPSLLTQHHSAIAALTKAALPKIETSSYVPQTLLRGFVPALQVSAV